MRLLALGIGLFLSACNSAGPAGTMGSKGDPGAIGPTGPVGATGATGPIGPTGAMGSMGAMGATGATGTAGQSAVVAFGYFFARMPSDNAATVPAGSPVLFPQDGPASGITRTSAGVFSLPAIGVYEVSWQVSVDQPGQLVLALDSGAGFVELGSTTVGRATGTTQLVGHALLTTTVINSTLTLRNPAASPLALTITTNAGGTTPVSAGLVIKRIS